MDYSKLKNGEKVAVSFKITGMRNAPIEKSAYGNAGKWSLDVIGHPTSGSGTIALTEKELGILANKLGLNSWKSLISILNKGIVSVETQATFNKKGAPYKDQKGVAGKYEVDHLRFNVNDYAVVADATITEFVSQRQAVIVDKLETEGVETASERATKLRSEVLRQAAGLAPTTTEDSVI